MRVIRILVAFVALLLTVCGGPEATPEERLRQHVSVLASEAFEGRGTGRAGERLAARYIADAFRAAGLRPAPLRPVETPLAQGFDVHRPELQVHLGPKPPA